MTPLSVRELVERIAGLEPIEDRHTLRLLDVQLDQTHLAEWAGLQGSPLEVGAERIIVRFGDDDESPEIMLADRDDLADRPLRIVIQKRRSDNVAEYYTLAGLKRALIRDDLCHTPEVRLAEEFEPFQTLATVVRPWMTASLDPWVAPLGNDGFDQPRNLVRSSGTVVPVRALSFILEEFDVAQASPIQTAFAGASAIRLAVCLCSEVWPKEDGDLAREIVLRGTRTVRVPIEENPSSVSPAIVHRAARWVFEAKNEAELRHTLLAAELARQWPAGKRFHEALDEVVENAIESAKSAYRIHIGKVSVESIRALGELRKALTDETGRIVALGSRLQGNLWGFLAAGVTSAILRIAALGTDSGKAALFVTRALLVTVAIIATISMVLLLWLSVRELKANSRLADQWRRHLTVVLSREEIEELSNQPIKEAQRDFRWASVAFSVIGFMLVGGLFWLASVSQT